MNTTEKEKIKAELAAIDSSVGRQITQRRRQLRISQEELGAAVGVTYQQMQKYEQGTNRVSAGKLYRFAQLLDVPIIYFFAESMTEAAGLDESFAYEPDLLKWIQAYPHVPQATRRSVTKILHTMSNMAE